MSSEKKNIPLSVPHLAGKEWVYIKECLDTNWVSYLGPFVGRFERKLAEVAQARHAVAVSSGTAALHVALHLSGVGRDDEVIMPAMSFVAPANAVRYCGAWPVFTDVNEKDWQWDVQQVADFLATGCETRNGRLVNRATGRRIAALLPVHLLGGMCDVDAVVALALHYDLPVIEDAAECLGATWHDRGIGAPSDSVRRIVTTSFNGNKVVTAGGGGALLCHDEELAARARHITTTAKTGTLEFYHDELGFNYRLTNIAAAMGLAQLESLSHYVGIKRQIAARYHEAFSNLPVVRHPEAIGCASIYWLYTILLRDNSRVVMHALNERGVMARPFWVPMPKLPAFAHAMVYRSANADMLYDRGISLPSSVGLSEEDQAFVISCLRNTI